MVQYQNQEIDTGIIYSSYSDFTSFTCPLLYIYVCKYRSKRFYHMCRFVEPPESGYRALHHHRDPSCYPFIITPILSPFPFSLSLTSGDYSIVLSLHLYNLITSKVISGIIYYVIFGDWLFPVRRMPLRSLQLVAYDHSLLLCIAE